MISKYNYNNCEFVYSHYHSFKLKYKYKKYYVIFLLTLRKCYFICYVNNIFRTGTSGILGCYV